MAFQLLDDLSASLRYENIYPHSYSPSGPQDKIPSNVELPPSGYTSHNSNQHSSASRHGTEFIKGECGDNRPFDHYAVNSHGHHALYPVGRPQTNDAPRCVPHHSHSPQSWPPYEGTTMGMSVLYDSFPSPSPFPPPRLSPPPLSMNGGLQHTRTLAGSLDPATGIFYRTPEHPRLRTAQACEKCRTRKAKCSGEHPSCKRCATRGLICEYAKEGRVRGPNKPKSKTSMSAQAEEARPASRGRTLSTNSSADSDHRDAVPAAMNAMREQQGAPSHSQHRHSLSLGEHRRSRPRPPNLQLETPPNHLRLERPSTSDFQEREQRSHTSYQQQPGSIKKLPPRLSDSERDAFLSLQAPFRGVVSSAPMSTSKRSDNRSHPRPGEHHPLFTPSPFHERDQHGRDDCFRVQDESSMTDPQLIFGEISPPVSASRSTSTLGSPMEMSSSIAHYNARGERNNFSLDALQGMGPGSAGGQLPLDPFWFEMHANPRYGSQIPGGMDSQGNGSSPYQVLQGEAPRETLRSQEISSAAPPGDPHSAAGSTAAHLAVHYPQLNLQIC